MSFNCSYVSCVLGCPYEGDVPATKVAEVICFPFVKLFLDQTISEQDHYKLIQTFHHCTEEFSPIVGLCCILLLVFVTSFRRKNDVTPSNVMSDVFLQ